MFKTTHKISPHQSRSRRLSFAFFSLLRYFKNIFIDIVPTTESRGIIQLSDNPIITAPEIKKENFFFRFINFCYFPIISTYKFIYRGTAKILNAIIFPLKIIGTFLFDKILDLAEFIYITVLAPFRDRFDHLVQGTIMILSSKPVGITLFIIIITLLSSKALTQHPKHALIYSAIPFIMLLIFYSPVAGLALYLFTGLGTLHKMIWRFPYLRVGTPVLLAAIASFVYRIIIGKEKDYHWVHDNQNIIILALWSIMTLAQFSGGSGRTLYYYLAIVNWFITYFVVIQIVGCNKKRLIVFLGALCFIYAMYSLNTNRNTFYYGWNTTHEITVMVRGRLADNNEMGASLCMALPLLVGFLIISKDKLLKGLFFLLICSNITAIIYCNSRGALLGLSIISLPIVVKMILTDKKIRKKGIIVFLVISVVGYAAFYEKVEKRFESIMNWKNEGSARNRITSLVTGTRAMLDKPVFGIGAGQLMGKFPKYCPMAFKLRYWFGKGDYLILSRPKRESQKEFTSGGSVGTEVHNAYAALAGESGFFVVSLWLFMMGYSIRQLYSLRRVLPKIPENEWAHVLSHALELSIISYSITANFLNNPGEGFIYMVIAATVSLRHIALKPKRNFNSTSVLWSILLFSIWLYYTFFMRTRFLKFFFGLEF